MTQPQGIAVVTGAASGMGEAAARLLAEAGWSTLLLCDLNAERLDASAQRIQGQAETLAGDISEPGYGDKLIAALGGRPIGALIHCAGLSPTMAGPERVLEVNLAATMRLVEAIRPHMAKGACAVLFASSAAHMGAAGFDERLEGATTPDAVASLIDLCPDSGMAYSVSKRGVKLLVEREALSFGKQGARIASISPGIIDTPMGRQEMTGHPIMQQIVDTSPLKRPAQAEEVAAVAVFLCTPAASYISGTDILVDAGSTTTLLRAMG
jgi:NAD(P)-dependent dehydrogenase (short-subunit alcohol dehydrogenase family)